MVGGLYLCQEVTAWLLQYLGSLHTFACRALQKTAELGFCRLLQSLAVCIVFAADSSHMAQYRCHKEYCKVQYCAAAALLNLLRCVESIVDWM